MKIKPLSKYLFFYQTSENFSTEKIKKIDAFLIILTILVSGSLINLTLELWITLIIITFILVSALIAKNNKVNRFALKNFCIILCLVVFIFFLKYIFLSETQAISQYITRFANIVTALLILMYFSDKPEYLIKIIYSVLYFIMLHALLSFAAWYVVKNSLIFVPSIKTNTFNYIFYYLHSDDIERIEESRIIEFYFLNFFRTSGIFWEPGILQFYMNILLFISLFIYRNIIISLLSIIVIITTWSSTGLIILARQRFFYLKIKIKRKNILAFIVAFTIFPLMLILLQENLIEKFEGKNSGSGFSRALDTFTAINIIKNNPFLGIDFDREAYDKELLNNRADIDMIGSRIERDASNTNSILNYFVFLGIPFGLAILYSLYNQNIFSKNKLTFFLIIFLSLQTEPIGFFIFPLMLTFSNYLLKSPSGALP